MEDKRPIPENDREKEEEAQMAELTKRIIKEIRESDADFTKKMFPPLYAAAWVMVEHGATSRQDLDAATRSLKEFMDRIRREHDKDRNRPNHDSSRGWNPNREPRIHSRYVRYVCLRSTSHHV